jgi:hypothetical protein
MKNTKAKLVAPIKVKVSKKITTPVVLLHNNKVKIILDKITDADKESILNIKIKTRLKQKTWESNRPSMLDPFQISNYFNATHKIAINGELQQPNHIQDWQEKLNFLFKTFLRCDLASCQIKEESSAIGSGILSSPECKITSEKILDLDTLNKIIFLLGKVNLKDSTQELMNFYLRLILVEHPLDIKGAFCVAILESLFLGSNERGGLSFKLSLRMTKMLGNDIEYLKKIKKLYTKRSKVFHGDKGKFDAKDVEFLLEEVTLAIEAFLMNQENFSDDKLDEILLS